MAVSLYNLLPRDLRESVRFSSTQSMLVISHAIEYVIRDYLPDVTLFVGFQYYSRFLPQHELYSTLANGQRRIYVFGVPDVEPPALPNVVYVPLQHDDPLVNEWFLVVNSASFTTALVGYSSNSLSPTQTFHAVWTYETQAIDNLLIPLHQLIDMPYMPVHHYNLHAQRRHIIAISQHLIALQEQAATKRALEQHRVALLEAGIARVDAALIVLDHRSHVIAVSPTAQIVVGGGATTNPDLLWEQWLDGMFASIALPADTTLVETLVLPDMRKLKIRCSPVYDQEILIGWVLVIRDITTTRQSTRQRAAHDIHNTHTQVYVLQELAAMLPQFKGRHEWQRLLVTHVQRLATDISQRIPPLEE